MPKKAPGAMNKQSGEGESDAPQPLEYITNTQGTVPDKLTGGV